MFGYGPSIPHVLLIMLVGFLWLVVLAVIAAILFFVIRWAVLSALKAHTRWVDAGKPTGSAWNQHPAPHPGNTGHAGHNDPFGAAGTPAPAPHVAPEPPAADAAAADTAEVVAPPAPPRKTPAKPRTPRTPKQP